MQINKWFICARYLHILKATHGESCIINPPKCAYCLWLSAVFACGNLLFTQGCTLYQMNPALPPDTA